MRIRSIRPEFWSSEDVAALDHTARLLFIGLWSYVDDNGVGRDIPALIVAALLPFDEPSRAVADVSRALSQLSDGGQITRYAAGGRTYLHVSSWSRHQKIDKPAAGRYPLPTCDDAVTREPSPITRESSAPGEGEKGRRGEDKEPPSLRSAPTPASHRPSTRGTRLPAGWSPPDAVWEAMRRELPAVDHEGQLLRFRDHWAAAPGQRGVKVDWPATWRTWVRRASESSPGRSATRSATEKAHGWGDLLKPNTPSPAALEHDADLLSLEASHR